MNLSAHPVGVPKSIERDRRSLILAEGLVIVDTSGVQTTLNGLALLLAPSLGPIAQLGKSCPNRARAQFCACCSCIPGDKTFWR